MKVVYRGWAIENSGNDLTLSFLSGVLFWSEPPRHCAAIRTAVFRTRDEARRHKIVARIKGKVIRATVTIETKILGGGKKMRKKKQIHFELPPDLYGKWKSFFRNLPRGTETKTLITLIIQFLEAEYDNGEIGVDFKSNRKG